MTAARPGYRSRGCSHLAAANLELSADEIKLLDEVSALPPEYPGWMLAYQAADRSGALDRVSWRGAYRRDSAGAVAPTIC
jgi:hypothetical protein